MPYSPPAGNAANFNFVVNAYTPPLGGATNFAFVTVWDVSITEAATATDAYSTTLSWTASIIEAATATDVVSEGLSWTATIAESATAADAVSQTLTWDAAVLEAATAADTYSQTLTWDASILEAASASDTVSETTGTPSVVEAASATDTISATLTWDASITEAATATDAVSATWVLPNDEVSKIIGVAWRGAGADQKDEVGKIVGIAWRGAAVDYHNEVGKIVGVAWRGSLPARNEVGKIVGIAVVKRRPPDIAFDPQFPPDLSYGSAGGCGWQTRVGVTTSGEEYRSAQWARTNGKWVVSKNLRTPVQWRALQAFHRLMQGKYASFRFKDWTDFTVNAGEGVLLPTTDFLARPVLAKKYTLTDIFGGVHVVYRPITKPVRFGVTFTSPNLADLDLDYSRGLVFQGIVGVTTWTGEFDIPARFDVDIPEIEMREPTGAGWRAIRINEVRSEIGLDDNCNPPPTNFSPFISP